MPNGTDAMPDNGAPSAFDVFMPRRPGTGETPVSADAGPSAPYPGNRSYIASPSYPASGSSPYPAAGSGPLPGAGASPFPGTGSAPFPGSGFPSYPDQPAPFPGWILHNTPGAADGRTAPGLGTPPGPVTPMTPVASPRPGQAAGPPWELPRESGPIPGPDESGPGRDAAEPDGNRDIKGLPRRVRQASLAPQLRESPPQRRTTGASAGPASGATGPSPAEIRQNMSALQRGWQEGRSQRMANPVSTESAASPSDPDPSAGGGADESTTNGEARGGSDGS